jgi:hypothetical protein
MHTVDLLFTNGPLARYYMFALLTVVPLARIFMRAGFKPYWAGLLVVPDAGLILCLALLALRQWPQIKGA